MLASGPRYRCEGLEPRLHLAFFDVVNTANAGAGSFRQAILNANATPGPDMIRFLIPGGGVRTIAPTTPLDPITDEVFIDGYTQPGASPNGDPVGTSAQLRIELSGQNAGAGSIGLHFRSGHNSVVEGLAINRFAAGILIDAPDTQVRGNFIGTDLTGTQALGNGAGVNIRGARATIGNISGQARSRNLISGNTHGVFLNGGGRSSIAGNLIGTDRTGMIDLGNSGNGILISLSPDNLIAGTDKDLVRNVISGNNANGVLITGSQATGNRIAGNFIGVAADGKTALANSLDGIRIEESASNNQIGERNALEPGAQNVIAFNGGNGVALSANAGSANTIRINSIHRNTDLGIDLSRDGITANDETPPNYDTDTGPNQLQNYPILTSVQRFGQVRAMGRLRSHPSQQYRIDFYSDSSGDVNGEGQTFVHTTVVRTDASGEAIIDETFAVGAGACISTTATRLSTNDTSEFSPCLALPAVQQALVTSPNDLGPGSLREALLLANSRPGLDLIVFNIPGNGPHSIVLGSPLPTVEGQVIIDGRSQPGYRGAPLVEITSPLASFDGLVFTTGFSAVIGLGFNQLRGTAAIVLLGPGGNAVVGNYIGTDITGTLARGNVRGIRVGATTSNNLIAHNVISGNTGIGVELLGIGNLLNNNRIGLASDGDPLGNFGDGVRISGSSNQIGGAGDDPSRLGNRIGFNGGDGVAVVGGTGNLIRGNSILENTGLGIDLADDGVTMNDPLDPDPGPNLRQNFPQIVSANKTASTTIVGSLSSAASAMFTVDFYASDGADATGFGEGERWLGSTIVTTNAAGTAPMNLTIPGTAEAGEVVTAVASDSAGNSSEFSQAVTTFDTLSPQVQSAQFLFDISPHRLEFSFSEDVSQSLGLGDISVQQIGAGAITPEALTYDPETNTATVWLDGVLPDGRFRATLTSAGVTDFAGNPLPADFVLDFFFLLGDANHDAFVNLADFNTLAGNFGQSPRAFSQADFNYDGLVSLSDFNILAGRFGVAVAPSVASDPAAVANNLDDPLAKLLE